MVLDQACRESDLTNLILSRDDGNKVIVVKGRSNEQGSYLKISKILRNDKEFMVFIPGGKGASGWVNVAYILRRSFGGETPPIISIPQINGHNFPPLLHKVIPAFPDLALTRDISMNLRSLIERGTRQFWYPE